MPRKKLSLDELMEIVDNSWCRQCLRNLAASSPEIEAEIVNYLKKHIREVDRETVADGLSLDLSCLDVEELWAHSGRTREGYVDVYEKAYEMFHELIEPGIDEMKRLQEQSRFSDACEYCIGIMQGISDFSTSGSEFLDWITDVPEDGIKETFDTWKEGDKSSPKKQAEVEALLKSLINK